MEKIRGALWISVSILALAASILALAALPAVASDDAAIERGQAHVEKTCRGCHAGPQLDLVVGRRLDPQDPAPLDAYLAKHFVPDASLRADVIAYLVSRAAEAPPGK